MTYTLWRGETLLGGGDLLSPLDQPAQDTGAAPESPLICAFVPTPAFFGKVAEVCESVDAALRRLRAVLDPVAGATADATASDRWLTQASAAFPHAEMRRVAALGLTVRDPAGRALGPALPLVTRFPTVLSDTFGDAQRAAIEAALGYRFTLTLLDDGEMVRELCADAEPGDAARAS